MLTESAGKSLGRFKLGAESNVTAQPVSEFGVELLRAGDAQPGLDRDGAFGLREDFVENTPSQYKNLLLFTPFSATRSAGYQQ